MFDALSGKFEKIFTRLRGRAVLDKKDIRQALDAIETALLEADVALRVVRDLRADVEARAQKAQAIGPITGGQQVVKMVHDALVVRLSGDDVAQGRALHFDAKPPVVFLLVGLQGSGKTTTTAKLASYITTKLGKRVTMASLDVNRPAAQEQLAILASEAGIDCAAPTQEKNPLVIAKKAMAAARAKACDVLLLDTAGRTSIDTPQLREIAAVEKAVRPLETLLVVDALSGQDALRTVENFSAYLRLSGQILTRLDGDARGGAALSLAAASPAPLKFIGVGEKLEDLDPFEPERMAGRILGQGDVVSLVEKASAQLEQQDAERMAKKMAKGRFDLDDMARQLSAMRRMGGFASLVGLLPKMGQVKARLDAMGDAPERMLQRQEDIIKSMTRKERRLPRILDASRKRRIAAGAGVEVSEINRLLKAHRQMADMMKKMKKKGGPAAFASEEATPQLPSDMDFPAVFEGKKTGSPLLPGLGGQEKKGSSWLSSFGKGTPRGRG